MTRKGWLLFAAVSIFWGIPYLYIKVAVCELDPTVAAGFHPIVLGSGKRLFRDGSNTTALRLGETKTFSSGVVLLS